MHTYPLTYRFITGIFTMEPGFTINSYKSENTQLGRTETNSFTDIRPDMRVFV